MRFFKQIEQEPISFSVGTGKARVIFHMRMISVAEEQKLRQRWSNLSENEKDQKNFEINVDALGTFAAKHHQIVLVAEDGTEELVNISAEELFSERSDLSERYAETAVRMFLMRLQLDASFL